MSTTIFKVALGLRLLTALALIQLSRKIIQMMGGNANVPVPAPTLIALGTLTDEYETANNAVGTTKAAWMQAVATAKQKRKLLEQGLNDEARTVDSIAHGDKAIILSCGMPATDEPDPVHLDQVDDLSLTRGDNPGSLDAHWHAIKKATNYTYEISHNAPDNQGNAQWERPTVVSKSSCTIDDLQSGSGIWVHVRANGSRGNGAFSDPAFLIVP